MGVRPDFHYETLDQVHVLEICFNFMRTVIAAAKVEYTTKVGDESQSFEQFVNDSLKDATFLKTVGTSDVKVIRAYLSVMWRCAELEHVA